MFPDSRSKKSGSNNSDNSMMNTLLMGVLANQMNNNNNSNSNNQNNNNSSGTRGVVETPEQQLKKKEKEEEEKSDDILDLSSVLNILDGTLETPGRIIILTSNYPEKLDQALIRPGRIDLILEFKKANHQIIREMYECYLECKPDETELLKIEEYKWSPAEVAQILFKNYNTPQLALKDLVEHSPDTYFKYSYFNRFDNDKTVAAETTPEEPSKPIQVARAPIITSSVKKEEESNKSTRNNRRVHRSRPIQK